MKAQVAPSLKAVRPPSSPSSKRPRRKAKYLARRGDSEVSVYETPVTVRGSTYESFTVSFYAQGKRQRRRFKDFPEAKLEADRIAEQKA